MVGSSGSGKSSLVRAGLQPMVHDEAADENGRQWRIVTIHPGDSPIGEFTTGLCDLVKSETKEQTNTDVLRARIDFALNFSSAGIEQVLQETLSFDDRRLLLVVDQFEELFRYAGATTGQREANKFVQLLLEASRSKAQQVHVLVTMRSDFIGDCAKFYLLPEAVSNAQFLVPSLTRDQREAAIVNPIEYAGGRIDPQLVQRLLNAAGAEMDDLPVLQHALARLWEVSAKRIGSTPAQIEPADYEQIGELEHALSNHADRIMAELNNDLAVEMVFRALSERDREGRATRRAIPFKQLVGETGLPEPDVRAVVDRFREDDCSFITPSRSEKPELHEGDRIDVGHEALLRRWERISGTPTAIGWLDEEENDGRWLRGLAALAGSR